MLEASDYSVWGGRTQVLSCLIPGGCSLRDRFTGKEDQEPDFGVPYTDFGARIYSPKAARWTVPDPESESYYGISPYAYCAGDPVNMVDLDGAVFDNAVDVGFVLYDLGASAFEKIRGNDAAASSHLKDAAANAVAALIPGYTAAATHLVRGVTKGAEAARAVDRAVDAGKAANKVRETFAVVKTTPSINIIEADKIDRSILNPPSKRGNAPTFKSDGTSVEIHHIGQNPDGPFKEMHWSEHRGKDTYRQNHPDNSSKIDRKEFNKQKKEYWSNEYKDIHK